MIDQWKLVQTLAKLEHPLEQLDYLSSMYKGNVNYCVLPPEHNGSFRLGPDLKPNFSQPGTKAPFPVFADELKAYLYDTGKSTLYLQSTPIEAFTAQLDAIDLFQGFEPV